MAAPQTATSRIHSASGTIQVPSASAERRAHLSGTSNFLANSIDRGVHDAGADAGQLEHLVVADDVDLAGLGDEPRVGGVDAVHVGVDLAADRRRSGGVAGRGRASSRAARATAVVSEPPRPSVVMLSFSSMPWKPATMTILPSSRACRMRVGGDVLDAGLGVGAVGDDADLGAGEADGLLAELLDGHGHQRDGDLLAGGQEHVHLAGRRVLGDLAGPAAISSSVVSPRALTTTMTWLPACLARMARRAAAMMRSALATLVPPNF